MKKRKRVFFSKIYNKIGNCIVCIHNLYLRLILYLKTTFNPLKNIKFFVGG